MAAYRIISSDNHVFEPPDLWTSRVEAKYRDRAPHVVREEDADWWYTDGIKGEGFGGGAQTGLRFEAPEKLSYRDRLENVRPGGYIPEEHVKDMDADGIDVSILYPTIAFKLYSVPDSELVTVLLHTYNDWVAEFCKPFPDRLKGIGTLNVDDVEVAVKEMERCAKMGLAGALISVYPPVDRQYNSPEYEPIWAAAQDLDMPLSLHIASNRAGKGQEYEHVEQASAAFIVNPDQWVRMSLTHIIFSGVLERYPKLQIGSVEHELAWIPHWLERMDYRYTQSPFGDDWYQSKGDMLPSEYFHRNMFAGFQQDGLGIRLRDIIGVDNLTWGSDYPHFESTFPRSRETLEEILADCTEDEKAKIAGGNAARIYHLD